MKYNTPNSSSLEYIYVDEEINNSNVYYDMRLKFKNKKRLYKYLIQKKLWNDSFKQHVLKTEGLNIGKMMWGYILSGEIIQFKTFTEIQMDED